MVNQKLLDYVGQQIKNGVSATAIKNALLGAGWPEPDVMEALQKAGNGNPPKDQQTFSVTQVSVGATGINPMQPAQGMAKNTAVDSMSAGMAGQSSPRMAMPASMGKMAGTTEMGSKNRGAKIGFVVLSVLVVGLVVASGYLYQQNQSIATELASVRAGADTSVTSMKATQKSLEESASQVATLKAQNESLKMEVAALAPAGAGQATTPVEVKLAGIIAESNGAYTLTTASGIVFSLKNAKDQKFEPTLKEAVGKQTQITGTHVAGSVSITVVSINGATP